MSIYTPASMGYLPRREAAFEKPESFSERSFFGNLCISSLKRELQAHTTRNGGNLRMLESIVELLACLLFSLLTLTFASSIVGSVIAALRAVSRDKKILHTTPEPEAGMLSGSVETR
jgi:hypothetical protein